MIIDDFRGDYAFLSNFFPCHIRMNGINYRNAEAAFQSFKLADPEERRRFSKLTPSEAKRLGRSVTLRPDWESIKIDTMRAVVHLKFLENRPLARLLIATGDAELIEGNTWHDTFWGVCNGVGQNNLGKILMAERERQKHRFSENKVRR